MISRQNRHTRRSFLHRVGAGGVAAALASALPARAADLQGTLRFGTWGGSWRDLVEKLVGGALKARGVDLQYVLGNPSNNLARLVAARGRETPIDCLEDDPATYAQFMQGKFLEKLALDRIPNAAALPAFAKSDYYVATGGILLGIVYNTQKFAEAGLPVPQTYMDLANPKLAGRVSFPDIGNQDHWYPAVGLAYEAGGDETALEKSLPLVAKINPAVFHPNSTDLATRFGSGEIWAAPWHAGFAVRLKRTGLPVAIAYPRIGDKAGLMALTYFHLVAGTKNAAAAEALANLYLAPDTQFEFAKFSGGIPTNPEARAKLAALPELKDVVPATDAALDKMLRVDFGKIDMAAWREKWDRRPR